MDTLPKPTHIVKDFIVGTVELLKYDDMLIALLLCLPYRLLQVHVKGSIILEEMLLSMFDDTVGTKRHKALTITAKVSKKFIGVIGAEYLLYLGSGALIDSGHGR
jgi:hypothetical protein